MKIIKLTKGYETIVDDETYKWAKHWKWCFQIGKNGHYAIHTLNQNKKTYRVRLHYLVIGVPLPGMVIDHINGNTLDNRAENLRFVTYQGNSLNKKMHREGRLPGIAWRNDRKKWRVYITINHKEKYIGLFNTEQEAHEAYMKAFNEIHN
jgi:hypothetical protein